MQCATVTFARIVVVCWHCLCWRVLHCLNLLYGCEWFEDKTKCVTRECCSLSCGCLYLFLIHTHHCGSTEDFQRWRWHEQIWHMRKIMNCKYHLWIIIYIAGHSTLETFKSICSDPLHMHRRSKYTSTRTSQPPTTIRASLCCRI